LSHVGSLINSGESTNHIKHYTLGFRQASGVGKLKPNIALMGYKSDWISCDVEDFKAYFRVIQ
jgi:hypothetical protein